jgi:Virulence factor BrkB
MASSQAILERGRGRRAATPSEISAPGWKDILLRVWKNIGEDRVMLVAAGVTFYCLLAIFPAIAALVAIYGFFSDPASISSHVDKLSGVMPGGALDVIRNQMNQVASQGPSKLGVAFIISFLVSLWSANAGIKSIFDALNLVYDEPEKRGLIRLKPFIVGFYRSRNPFHPGCDCLHCRAPSSRFEPIARCNCCHRADRALADSLYHYRRRSCFCLPLWPEPRRASTAMDHLGKRPCCNSLDRGFAWVLLVRGQLRQLQQDLWIAGRSRRPHVLALALGRNHPDRRRAGCRNGASDGARYNGWPRQADGSARR